MTYGRHYNALIALATFFKSLMMSAALFRVRKLTWVKFSKYTSRIPFPIGTILILATEGFRVSVIPDTLHPIWQPGLVLIPIINLTSILDLSSVKFSPKFPWRRNPSQNLKVTDSRLMTVDVGLCADTLHVLPI